MEYSVTRRVYGPMAREQKYLMVYNRIKLVNLSRVNVLYAFLY